MISVIIPMYNSENTIVRCLDSVINQTYNGNLEIIIVNDGSLDKSKDIVEKYIADHGDLNIKQIDKLNGGVSSARNAGMKVAKGDWIALLDSDDEWFEKKLDQQITLAQNYKDISFVSGLIFEPQKGSPDDVTVISLKNLVFKNYFQPSTVIFKKEILQTVGYFDETQKYAEEGNYFMRIAKQYKCALMNQQLVLYDQGKKGFGQSGLSANLKEMQKGEMRNLKFAFENRYINVLEYSFSYVFSIAKYIRRIIIVKFKR